MFKIYSDTDLGSTLVPNQFIDEYMSDANDAQIKIYLYLLRMMSSGRETTVTEIADRFNYTEREVIRSLRYWQKKGLLHLEFNGTDDLIGVHFVRMNERPAGLSSMAPERYSAAAPAGLSSMVVPGHGDMRYDPLQSPQTPDRTPVRDLTGDVRRSGSDTAPAQPVSAFTVPAKSTVDDASINAFRSNASRAQLLFVTEQYIGKPLSPAEVQSLYYISEELHFSEALIDYLLQYCIDRGKKDFRYIEKVAVNWAENGITTPKQAERAVSPVGKRRGGTAPASNPFNRFEQNQYDFDELEKELLSN